MKWYDLLKATGPFASIGWLIHLFDRNRSLIDGIGEGVNNVWNKYTGSALTGAEREANAFSAEQADKQRAWEEEMRNTSFQAQVKDMQAAGLNAALMYGGAGSSGATVPSSASPSSVSPSNGDLSGLVGSILDIALLGAQKRNIDANTEKIEAETEGLGIENAFKPSLLEQNLRKAKLILRILWQVLSWLILRLLKLFLIFRSISPLLVLMRLRYPKYWLALIRKKSKLPMRF